MNKVKVKIKKLPVSNQGSPNFNEMAYQYTSSNPLSFKDLKDSTRMIGEDQYEIGKNYPTEKDPKKANIEAEKGELILTKDFELYKINGKPHTKGGTPLAVNEGDFIFSKKLEGSGKDFNKIFGNFDEKDHLVEILPVETNFVSEFVLYSNKAALFQIKDKGLLLVY